MKKDLNLSNVLIAIIMCVVGVILVVNSQSIINMMSWIIGIVIILISVIKIISLFNDKILDTTSLAINILFMAFGILLISFPSIVDVAIKFVFGSFILFSGIKRLILAVALSRVDKNSHRTFLITSILMMALGALVLINFYDLLGIFLIIYSVIEIGNYIYFLVKKNNFSFIFDKEQYDEEVPPRQNKKSKITKEMKNRKAIDAQIEE